MHFGTKTYHRNHYTHSHFKEFRRAVGPIATAGELNANFAVLHCIGVNTHIHPYCYVDIYIA